MSSLMLDLTGITESVLLQLRAMEDETAAAVLDCRLRSIDAQERRGYAEKGLIVLEVEQRLLWRFLLDSNGIPYTGLTRWVREAAPWGYATCFAAKEDVKELLKDIPVGQITGVPRCNILTLKMLSSSIRSKPEILESAKTKQEKDFIAEIQRYYPDQHIESRRLIHLHPPESASSIITRGFKLVMEHEHLTTREQVLEFWASRSIQEYEDEPQREDRHPSTRL